MNIEVIRGTDDGRETLGEMFVYDEAKHLKFKCYTLELPDKANQKRISCIPKGTYKWSKVGSSANIPYPHVAIHNVPNRDGICIHKANYVSQLLGCIAVGTSILDINGDGEKDVASSGVAFDKLMITLSDNGTITIL